MAVTIIMTQIDHWLIIRIKNKGYCLLYPFKRVRTLVSRWFVNNRGTIVARSYDVFLTGKDCVVGQVIAKLLLPWHKSLPSQLVSTK